MSPIENGAGVIDAVGGRDPAGHLWSTGTPGILIEYHGSSWNTVDGSVARAAWGADATDVFFSDCGMSLGGTTRPPSSCIGGYTGNAVWGSSAMDVHVVGAHGIWHLNGTTWSHVTSSWNLAAIWGSAAGNIYAVGTSCTVTHFNGMQWTQVGSLQGCGDLHGVWGSDASHVFVVGDGGVVLRYDGSQWATATIGGGVNLYAVWGTGPSDVWAVGDGGAILHFDGAAWAPSPYASRSVYALHAVWGSSGSDVFAAGDVSTIVHFDGTNWDPIRYPALASLTSIWGDGRRVYFGNGQFVLDRTSQPTGACAAHETSCGDAIDDDCDLLVDCADPDCRGSAECP
jgi:hypothetical protein